MIGASHRIRALLLCGGALCALATCASAQSESQYRIRVESDLVVAPIVVRERAVGTQPLSEWRDPEGHRDVLGLTATDFRLSEDGVEQAIQSVTVEPWRNRMIRDSTDCHLEDFAHWGVKWTSGLSAYRPCPSTSAAGIAYLVAYRPSPSPPGGCHKIAVTVNHRDVIVFNRKEYCNTPDSASTHYSARPWGKKWKLTWPPKAQENSPCRFKRVSSTPAARRLVYTSHSTYPEPESEKMGRQAPVGPRRNPGDGLRTGRKPSATLQ